VSNITEASSAEQPPNLAEWLGKDGDTVNLKQAFHLILSREERILQKLENMEKMMVDAATALSELGGAVKQLGDDGVAVAGRVGQDMAALKNLVAQLQQNQPGPSPMPAPIDPATGKTIDDLIAGIEANVSQLQSIHTQLANIDPANPSPPAAA
jgi:hypothetical protein